MVLAVSMASLLGLCATGLLPANPASYLLALIVCVLLSLAFVAFMLIVVRRSGARWVPANNSLQWTRISCHPNCARKICRQLPEPLNDTLS